MYTIKEETNVRRVIVIGGGAAGMMAAIKAADMGAEVTLFEKNDRMGKKLRITGKGRCNLTNDCEIGEFLKNVPTNPRFLYGALNRFSPEDTKAFFEDLGEQSIDHAITHYVKGLDDPELLRDAVALYLESNAMSKNDFIRMTKISANTLQRVMRCLPINFSTYKKLMAIVDQEVMRLIDSRGH